MNKIIVGVQAVTHVSIEESYQAQNHGTHISASLPYVLTKHGVVLLKGDGIGSI